MRHWLQQNLKNWFVRPSSGIHFDCADGLRGLAILLVVALHGFYFNPEGSAVYSQLHKIVVGGWLGVPIFFVLSAFLLSLPFFRGRQQDPRFWYARGYTVRRILKILPPFYLVIAGLALLYYWRDGDPVFFKVGLAWATGVAHFVYFPQPFNGAFWSLWVEIGFYVVLPLLFLALRGRRARTVAWVSFAVLLIAPFISRLITWPDASNRHIWFFILRRFPSSLDTFAWGMLFGYAYIRLSEQPERARRLAPLGYAGIGFLLLAGLLSALKLADGGLPDRWAVELSHLLPGISAFLLLFFVFDPDCLGSRFFSSPAMRFLGIVSFEWFLIHQPAQFYFRMWMGGAHGSLLRYFFIVLTPTLLSLGLAILVYHKFSLPIMRWGRERVRAKDKRPPVAAPRELARP